MIPKIIHEDDSIIVTDKPAGMPSTSLTNDEMGTLASWLIEKFPALTKIEKGRLEAGLVHRLDNDTSGVIVAAKNQDVYAKLRRQFELGEKEYLAVVAGNPPKTGAIDAPIAHSPRKKKKMIVVTAPGRVKELKARPARTEFRVKKKLGKYSFLAVNIKTGARHQIRVHLAAAGFPIAGDRLYQNSKERVLDKTGAARHLLHASKIKFSHPKTGKVVSYSSPMPDDMKEVIGRLLTG